MALAQFRVGRDLCITVTVRNKQYLVMSPRDQLLETAPEVIRLLRRCCKDFSLAPELTEDGIIHFHGILKGVDRVKWYKSTLYKLRRQFGFCRIEKGRTPLGYFIYLRKDQRDITDIMRRRKNNWYFALRKCPLWTRSSTARWFKRKCRKKPFIISEALNQKECLSSPKETTGRSAVPSALSHKCRVDELENLVKISKERKKYVVSFGTSNVI